MLDFDGFVFFGSSSLTRLLRVNFKPWKEIEALMIGLGAQVSEREGSRVAIVLFNEVRVFHRPHPSPKTDKGAVVSVKKWLEQHGVRP